MRLKDFENRHTGEDIIIVCNGVSLRRTPRSFLKSKPLFAMNFFPWYEKEIMPLYWMALDAYCFTNIPLLQEAGIPAFVPDTMIANQRLKERGLNLLDNIVRFKLLGGITNLGYDVLEGVRYKTTLTAVTHIADYMGFSRFLLVGFDCSFSEGKHQLLEDEGIGFTTAPHWYDPNDRSAKRHEDWNQIAGHLYNWLKIKNKEFVNLSAFTLCDTMPRGYWGDYV